MAPEHPNSSTKGSGGFAVGIDVGGSSIKGGVVELADGDLVGERRRVSAPAGFHPESVIEAIANLASWLSAEGPIGVGFPAIVREGLLLTDPTSHEWPGWKGRKLGQEISELTGRPVSIANDADVAALAEQRFGAARGVRGTVLVLTLGTGIGSGLLRDGRLFPGIELGRIYLPGEEEVAEEQCSARVRTEQNLGWAEYGERLQRYLTHIERIVAPDLIVIGGAVSTDSEDFLPRLQTRARLVAAGLLGDAGMIGGAILTERED